MRVAFHIREGEIVGAAEMGTLSLKRTQAFDARRVEALSQEILSLLARTHHGHTLDGTTEKQLCQLGGELRHALVAPDLSNALENKRSIYLHVDEPLVVVPWEMLFDGKEFWCRRFDLGRAIATPQSITGRSPELPTLGSLRMLIVCCDFSGRLPLTIDEGESLLAKVEDLENLEVDLLINPKVETVHGRLKQYDLVHFAGHADHNESHPSQSGWHLADGKLTAQQILDLGKGAKMPLMVFSNACRSGESKAWSDSAGELPDGATGLSNAFLRSGVGLFIGPQWEVEDAQSARLAADFYDVLFRGANVGMALRVAKERASHEKGLSWASYQLYGDPQLCPVATDLEEEMSKRIPSNQALGKRLKSPYARPSGSSPTANRTNGHGVKERIEPRPKRRAILGLVVIGLSALLSAVGLTYWQATSQKRPHAKQVPPKGPGANPSQLSLEIESTDGTAVPTTAIALADGYKSLRACLGSALDSNKGFRLLPVNRAMEIAVDQGLKLDAGLNRENATRLGRELGAEILIYAGADGKTLTAIDPLTKELLVDLPLTKETAKGCGGWMSHLQRVVHGEGAVISLGPGTVTVNLGWRSRITPGSTLEVLHANGKKSELKVIQVELDRSVANGAGQVGDKVYRRHAPP